MPEITLLNFKKYYHSLEIVFQFLLMTMMFLFGATFLAIPNQNIFRIFAQNAVHVTPVNFAITCFVFALICPVMLSPWARRIGAEGKAAFAIVATAPMIFYFLMVFFIMVFVEHTFTITPVFYFSNYILIILAPVALFRGYRRWIEVVSIAALCAIYVMFIIALIANPSLTLFNKFNANFGANFNVITMLALCLLSIIGYLGMLFPLKRFSCRFRRVLFLAFESPIGLVTVFYLYNAVVTTGAAVIPPLAFVNLSFLIALLGYALCPTGRRLYIQLTG